MRDQKPATPREMVFIGTGFAAVGLYFILVGLGVLPVPGGRANLHSPLWIVVCAGAPFFLGGLSVLLQGIGKVNADGELPADAPAWVRATQHLFAVLVLACFAVIGSWIALAGDPRQVSGSVMGIATGPGIARIAFGIGAIICWACTIGAAVSAVRKITAIHRRRQA